MQNGSLVDCAVRLGPAPPFHRIEEPLWAVSPRAGRARTPRGWTDFGVIGYLGNFRQQKREKVRIIRPPRPDCRIWGRAKTRCDHVVAKGGKRTNLRSYRHGDCAAVPTVTVCGYFFSPCVHRYVVSTEMLPCFQVLDYNKRLLSAANSLPRMCSERAGSLAGSATDQRGIHFIDGEYSGPENEPERSFAGSGSALGLLLRMGR